MNEKELEQFLDEAQDEMERFIAAQLGARYVYIMGLRHGLSLARRICENIDDLGEWGEAARDCKTNINELNELYEQIRR